MVVTHVCSVRWFRRSDRAEMARVEEDCFEVPRDEWQLGEMLRGGSAVGLVAELDGVVGHLLYEPSAGELKIDTVAVRPEFRRRGVASRLVETLIEAARLAGRGRVWTSVPEANLAAQLLFRSCGFEVQAHGWIPKHSSKRQSLLMVRTLDVDTHVTRSRRSI